MMQWILARLGFAVIDLDVVAKSMAGKVIADYEPDTLDAQGAIQYFKTRYTRIAIEYGLPLDCVDAVATKAWAIVAASRNVPVNVPQMVELYD